MHHVLIVLGGLSISLAIQYCVARFRLRRLRADR